MLQPILALTCDSPGCGEVSSVILTTAQPNPALPPTQELLFLGDASPDWTELPTGLWLCPLCAQRMRETPTQPSQRKKVTIPIQSHPQAQGIPPQQAASSRPSAPPMQVMAPQAQPVSQTVPGQPLTIPVGGIQQPPPLSIPAPASGVMPPQMSAPLAQQPSAGGYAVPVPLEQMPVRFQTDLKIPGK